jgi:hypothetical protein
MTNITETAVNNDTVFIGDKVETLETLTGTVSGTAGSVTDTTTYAVADQSGKTEKITVDGGTEQTVTFPASTTTALQVAAAINDQWTGLSATTTGGQVVVTSDSVGANSSIAIGTGTTDLTWGTPVAGTGSGAAGLTIAKGTLIARNTSTSKMEVYVSGGANGTGTPLGVIDTEQTYTATGDKRVMIGRAGKVDKTLVVVNATGAVASTLELDSLAKNSSIVAVDVNDTGRSDI